MTARYDAEVALLRDQPLAYGAVKVPELRVLHDADELRRLADWLRALVTEGLPDANGVALDYHRLADALTRLSTMAREYAATLTRPIP
jgi:hypothetical protein